MTDGRLQELMDRPAPGEHDAERRAHDVIRAAHAERESQPSRMRPLIAVAMVLAALVVAMMLTPAGGAVADWIRTELVERPVGERPAMRALTSLPSGGELLVSSPQGPWIVGADGAQRRLGAYDDASWSPGGLYVIATRGHQLAALTPLGDPRWTLTREERVTAATWAPSGLRVAYLSGGALRTVQGDGDHDAMLARGVAATPPAWRPGDGDVVAFADLAGRVEVLDVTGERPAARSVWRSSRSATRPLQLAWSSDGERLLAVARDRIRVFDRGGRLLDVVPLRGGVPATAVDAARILEFAPGRHAFAVLRTSRDARRSEVVLLRAEAEPSRPRPLFEGPGAFSELAWSPNGSRLLIGWPSADQWLFLRPDRPARVKAVSNVARQFSPGAQRPSTRQPEAFPEISGWCCGS